VGAVRAGRRAACAGAEQLWPQWRGQLGLAPHGSGSTAGAQHQGVVQVDEEEGVWAARAARAPPCRGEAQHMMRPHGFDSKHPFTQQPGAWP